MSATPPPETSWTADALRSRIADHEAEAAWHRQRGHHRLEAEHEALADRYQAELDRRPAERVECHGIEQHADSGIGCAGGYQ